MKFIENIEESKFNDFVLKQNNFMQTSYFGQINKFKGFEYHLVGLEENDQLLATAMILEKKLIKQYTYLYIPRGYIINFNDNDLLSYFTDAIRKFGKKRKAIFICIDPDLLVYDKQKDIAKFKSLGFKHMGFNDYFENRQPRFTYNLKLNNLETIAHNFHPTTRKIYHRGNVYDLEITKGSINDITNFSSLMKETGRRNNAIFFSEEYYKSFYQLFNMHNMSDIYIAKINMDHLKNIYKTKIAELNYKLLKSKNDNNKNDLDNQLNKYKKEFMEIKEIKDKDLILSSIITVKTNNKVFTVHGGNANNLRFLNANYWLYFKIIEDSLNDNFKEIDFFGTIGNDNKCNSGYGIHLFKRRLGGDKLEYIGEFDLILNKFLYFLYKKIYSKLKHRK